MALMWRIDRYRLAEAALILLPAGILFLGLSLHHWSASGHATGMGHLQSETFPAPVGWSLGLLVPSVGRWVDWFGLYLTNETLIGARRGAALYPLVHLVTLSQVGAVLALGWLIFKRTPKNSDEPSGPAEDADQRTLRLRRLILGALVSLLVIQVIYMALWAGVGRVHWSSRQFLLVEFLVLLPVVMGWSWLMGRPWPFAQLGRGLIWAGAALLFSRSTWPYLALLRGD